MAVENLATTTFRKPILEVGWDTFQLYRDVIIASDMDTTVKDNIIAKAGEYHATHPFDAAHDLAHHEAVLANSREIVEKEKLEGKVDLDVLEVAAMVHDINDKKRGSVEENTEAIRSVIKESGGDDHLIENVLNIIGAHSFGEGQEGLESQVLFDADKLEYVAKSRFEAALRAVNSGEMTREKLEEYKKLWRGRIGSVKEALHFESSKKIFDLRYNDLIEYVRKGAPEYQDSLEGVI